ncbi:alpha/beta fold hydrolase [Pelagibius sp. 7325]|uniref:esterase/lipase family protein n=1 Tax=Pelagibius sp. 7325 TaxID=3131994 RepID=UPI0030EE68AA
MRRFVTRRRAVLLLGLAALLVLAIQLNRTQLWEDRQVYAGWRVQQHVVLGNCRLLDREDRTRARGWNDACAGALEEAKRRERLAPRSRHLVLLLHGMGRSTYLFRDMQHDLRAAGYEAVAISYPSLTRDIAGHADQVEALLRRAQDAERVSFVTHSLGGLVVRELINRDGLWNDQRQLGRIVMLAPPNQGSELAEVLELLPPYHWIGGPSASEIAAGPPFALPPENVEIAVIAGGTAGGGGFNPLLSGNNDGVVTVAETDLPGVRDRLTVPALHTLIAASPQTIAATLNFLENGRLR